MRNNNAVMLSVLIVPGTSATSASSQALAIAETERMEASPKRASAFSLLMSALRIDLCFTAYQYACFSLSVESSKQKPGRVGPNVPESTQSNSLVL